MEAIRLYDRLRFERSGLNEGVLAYHSQDGATPIPPISLIDPFFDLARSLPQASIFALGFKGRFKFPGSRQSAAVTGSLDYFQNHAWPGSVLVSFEFSRAERGRLRRRWCLFLDDIVKTFGLPFKVARIPKDSFRDFTLVQDGDSGSWTTTPLSHTVVGITPPTRSEAEGLFRALSKSRFEAAGGFNLHFGGTPIELTEAIQREALPFTTVGSLGSLQENLTNDAIADLLRTSSSCEVIRHLVWPADSDPNWIDISVVKAAGAYAVRAETHTKKVVEEMASQAGARWGGTFVYHQYHG